MESNTKSTLSCSSSSFVASRSVQNPTDTSGTASGGTCGTLDHTNSITGMISGSKFTSSNASWKWLADEVEVLLLLLSTLSFLFSLFCCLLLSFMRIRKKVRHLFRLSDPFLRARHSKLKMALWPSPVQSSLCCFYVRSTSMKDFLSWYFFLSLALLLNYYYLVFLYIFDKRPC